MKAQTDDVILAALTQLFPAGVKGALSDPQKLGPGLMASEKPAIANARAARQTEFVAGRRAARRAMAALGLAPAPIPAGPDRAPIWPTGVIGSISHTREVCVAVVALESAARSLGVDVEFATSLEPDLMAQICSPLEQSRIEGPEMALHAKLIFSAKEATYKAQYPLTGQLIGFDHLDVTLDLENNRFTAIFLHDTGCFVAGTAITGQFAKAAEHFVTGVCIAHLDQDKEQ